MVTSHVCLRYNIQGYTNTVCTACAAGAQAIGEAVEVIRRGKIDLMLAGGLVLLLAILAILMQLGVARSLLVAAIRTTVQLLLIGLVLKTLFENVHLAWVSLLAKYAAL